MDTYNKIQPMTILLNTRHHTLNWTGSGSLTQTFQKTNEYICIIVRPDYRLITQKKKSRF